MQSGEPDSSYVALFDGNLESTRKAYAGCDRAGVVLAGHITLATNITALIEKLGRDAVAGILRDILIDQGLKP